MDVATQDTDYQSNLMENNKFLLLILFVDISITNIFGSLLFKKSTISDLASMLTF